MRQLWIQRIVWQSCLMLFACGGSILLPGQLNGQGHFRTASGGIEYPRYAAVWECLSAVQRVQDSLDRSNPVWLDTLPIGTREEHPFIPELVVQAARQCGQQIPDSSDHSRAAWIELLLVRNDTTAVERLVRQAILEPLYSTPEKAMYAIRGVLNSYRNVPGRTLLAPEVISAAVEKHTLSPEIQAIVWGDYLTAARVRRDERLAELAGGYIAALVGRLTGTHDGGELRSAIMMGIQARYKRESVDTLRAGGTAAFRTFWETVFNEAKVAGWLQGLYSTSIGEPAQPVESVVWYPQPSPQRVPAPGQVSLLIFLDSRSHTSRISINENFNLFATIRRLKQRFPDLDITIATRTLGWFWQGPPLQIREEGDVMRRWLLEARKLPVRLAIDSTPWFRLPAPDGRRVNMESDNDRNYSLGVAGFRSDRLVPNEKAVLVSRDGMIILVGSLRRESEQEYAELIDILLQKPATPQ